MPALFTNTWMRSSARSSCAATDRTLASEARSPRNHRTEVPGTASSIAATAPWARSALRATSTSWAPRRASTIAAAAPMPAVAPVMTTVLPRTLISPSSSQAMSIGSTHGRARDFDVNRTAVISRSVGGDRGAAARVRDGRRAAGQEVQRFLVAGYDREVGHNIRRRAAERHGADLQILETVGHGPIEVQVRELGRLDHA